MNAHRVLHSPLRELVIIALILLATGGAFISLTVTWPLIQTPSRQVPAQADPWEVVDDFHTAINRTSVDEVVALFADSAGITDNKSVITGRDHIQDWILHSKRMARLHLRMVHSEMKGKMFIWLDEAQNGPEEQNRYYLLRWEAVIAEGKIQALVVKSRYMPDLK